MVQGKIGILLGVAAAYMLYTYAQLTPEQKQEWKAKRRKLIKGKWGIAGLFRKVSSGNRPIAG